MVGPPQFAQIDYLHRTTRCRRFTQAHGSGPTAASSSRSGCRCRRDTGSDALCQCAQRGSRVAGVLLCDYPTARAMLEHVDKHLTSQLWAQELGAARKAATRFGRRFQEDKAAFSLGPIMLCCS